MYIGAIILGIFLILFIVCNLIPVARIDYWGSTVVGSYREIWTIVPSITKSRKEGWKGILLFGLAVLLSILLSVLVFPLMLIAPAECIYGAIKHHNFKYETLSQSTKPIILSEEVKAQIKAYHERLNAIRFVVEKEDVSFELDDREVIFYSPVPSPELEQEISANLESIKSAFASKKYHFFFLPEFNSAFSSGKYSQQLEYYSPINGNCTRPGSVLSYEEIRNKLHVPDRVDAPCFIRYNKRIGEEAYYFSYYRITEEGILSNVQDYLTKVGSEQLFSISRIEDFRQRSEGQTADETFDQDVLLLGKEIRERVNQLKARGLTALAISKLIGDIDDNPSRLVIDRHNKIFLPDYNNKEIKLSPIHKAVFFLFLNHPEGIYFKDLPSYKEELGHIYGSITGREDRDAIDESIEKLTNPFDNSINEKCARIKNAFVSEFREELAQWYFIDGRKGEKKTIKISRDLVIWEVKD